MFPNIGHRRNTGIKYHRITGSENKEVYNRGWAMGAADSHAGDFVRNRERQIEHLRSILPVEPLVLSPFDAELFGHWWFEGPEFLDLVLRKAAYDQDVFRLTTPSIYLSENPTLQMVAPSPSKSARNASRLSIARFTASESAARSTVPFRPMVKDSL